VTHDALGVGLCAACRHARRIRTTRGSTFHLCARAAADARFARYPPLPVTRCPGYEPGEPPAPADGEPA
jgi:hypothetical protein